MVNTNIKRHALRMNMETALEFFSYMLVKIWKKRCYKR